MPISRPLLIVLAAAVLALVGFYATQGARDASSGGDDAAEVAPPTPSHDSVRADAADASKPETAKPKPETAKPKARDAEAKAQHARAEARREAEEQRGMPLAVARALNSRKLVVLLLRGTDSADDRAAARAVAGLRGQRGLAVFSDRIARLGRYRAVVGDLGISQAPAVVIVDRGRTARVVQGYIDPATLAQDVADAR
jgi:hypothetical protein